MGYFNASGRYAHKRVGKSPRSRITEHRPHKRTIRSDSSDVRKAQERVLKGAVAVSAGVLGKIVLLVCKAR